MSHAIICPTCGVEHRDAGDELLEQIYLAHPHFQQLCDQIHNARMGPGKACPQCIHTGLFQVLEKYEQAH